jgi:hypothetical protein
MVDQLCCRDLLLQIEVWPQTMVFWTYLPFVGLRRARYRFQGASTIIVERVPGTKQLEGFISATILKLACIQIRAPLLPPTLMVSLIASVLSINS